jgi:hypothetical protein
MLAAGTVIRSLAALPLRSATPDAADATSRALSMVIRFVAPDGQESRSRMNNSSVFAVANPRAFL